ncbi:MAG TPA: 2OG-Fe(II) oxygenase [Planctomycetaceae bacterium]|nr:2OG-Fe(II) oxygenase [Planctomycetaceae bacterium]
MRYVELSNWAPAGLVNAALAEWPAEDWRHWHFYDDQTAKKRATKDASRLPRAATMLLERMAELDLRYHGFDADCFPDLELHGAGMHELPTGGFLRKHLDSTAHPQTRWNRSVNGVLFLNEPEQGGDLTFHLPFEEIVIHPESGKLVLFETADEAWHSVSTVAGSISRKTLSLFWWTLGTPDERRMKAEFVE